MRKEKQYVEQLEIIQTENGTFACQDCGEVLIDPQRKHYCTKKSSDNQGNPELLFEQSAAVDSMLDEITASENALNALVDLYSEAKSRIAGHLAKNLKQAFAETKKSAGIDQLMLWAGAQTPELQKDYETYIELSKTTCSTMNWANVLSFDTNPQ